MKTAARIALRIVLMYAVAYFGFAAAWFIDPPYAAPFHWPRPYPPLFFIEMIAWALTVTAAIMAVFYFTRKPEGDQSDE